MTEQTQIQEPDPACGHCGCPYPGGNCWDGVTAAAWRPISTAPISGEPIILFARHVDATASVPVIGFFLEEHGGWIAQSFMGQGIARLVPSHWMPRPTFPN